MHGNKTPPNPVDTALMFGLVKPLAAKGAVVLPRTIRPVLLQMVQELEAKCPTHTFTRSMVENWTILASHKDWLAKDLSKEFDRLIEDHLIVQAKDKWSERTANTTSPVYKLTAQGMELAQQAANGGSI